MALWSRTENDQKSICNAHKPIIHQRHLHHHHKRRIMPAGTATDFTSSFLRPHHHPHQHQFDYQFDNDLQPYHLKDDDSIQRFSVNCLAVSSPSTRMSLVRTPKSMSTTCLSISNSSDRQKCAAHLQTQRMSSPAPSTPSTCFRSGCTSASFPLRSMSVASDAYAARFLASTWSRRKVLSFLILWMFAQAPVPISGNQYSKALGAISGNLVLGALFPVHHAPSANQAQTRTCGEVREQYGIQRVEAAFHTIDQINRNVDILPNITLGIEVRDSCWYVLHH